MIESLFAEFLKKKLLSEAQKYEKDLLSANFDNILDVKRVSGIKDTLVGISNSLDNISKEFSELNNSEK